MLTYTAEITKSSLSAVSRKTETELYSAMLFHKDERHLDDRE